MSFVDRGSLIIVVQQGRKCCSYAYFLLVALLFTGCSHPDAAPLLPLFSQRSPTQSGISFVNKIVEHEGFNVLEYEYFFNGGGVAIGDLNNDGLPDVYFTANMEPDHLYLNKGALTFEDISLSAGLKTDPGWTTGVTMADVNGDGWLDLYVCRSGQVSEDRRRNLLYINNGNLTFTESAAAYGLDDPSYSNHAAFFDYDRDGDLDVYLLNHPIRRFSNFDVALMKQQRDPLAGDKLFRNDAGKFVDVSAAAGIIGNPLGFGLSVVVSDINRDGWPDLYVANDYIEEDYLYINMQNGTFAEEIKGRLTHSSYSSMGSDVADLNNDGFPEIMSLDMMAEGHVRQKILKGPENHVFYDQMRERGIHEQYMRNMLHLNDGRGAFAEIGQLAGVSNTDWSWSVLLADFDNNSYKDIVVTNGYLRDYTNLDYLETTLAGARKASAMGETFSALELVQKMPSTKLLNYVFSNTGQLQFANQTANWGFDAPSFSNGAAYGDLDLDGDLDLIISNINQEAFIFRNNSEQNDAANFLRLELEGPEGNRWGLGSEILLTSGDSTVLAFYVTSARGYLSSVDPVVTAGLGLLTEVDLMVTWPDGQRQSLERVKANQTIQLAYKEQSVIGLQPDVTFLPLMYPIAGLLDMDFEHLEDQYSDFDSEPLLPHMFSRNGPALAVSDVNKDNLQDVFVGGARGQAGALYLQQPDGLFRRVPVADFENHAGYEDVDAVFFDVDGDFDVDLFVASAGNIVTDHPEVFQDRVYLNNGFGAFSYDAARLPPMYTGSSSVAPHDFDKDGDVDVFVGGSVKPGNYPHSARSYLLENEGGFFKDIPEQVTGLPAHPGIVTDASWADINGDGSAELIIAGEWMPLRVFSPDLQGNFKETTAEAGLGDISGWWNKIETADLDGDGDLDLVAGNEGLNSQLNATSLEPLRIYAQDMDANGKEEFVVTNYISPARHTIYWRDELISQVPRWAALMPDNNTYAQMAFSTLENNMPPGTLVLDVTDFETRVFENNGEGFFSRRKLPLDAQMGPINDAIIADLNRDGMADIIMAGNDFTTRPQMGPSNGGRGVVLLGKGMMDFEALPPGKSGFYASGDVRKMAWVNTANGPVVVVVNNNGPVQVFSFNPLEIPPVR